MVLDADLSIYELDDHNGVTMRRTWWHEVHAASKSVIVGVQWHAQSSTSLKGAQSKPER